MHPPNRARWPRRTFRPAGILLFLCIASWLSPFATAQNKPAPAKAGSRWALLIGVDDYAEAEKLNFCGADMLALRDRLVAAGVPKEQVFVLHDKADETKYRPIKGNIQRQLDLLLKVVEKDDLVVVGFSGHGVHLRGKSYLCPTETRLDDPETMVPLESVYGQLEHCPASLKLLLVDACRNDPRPGGQKSLAPTEGTKQFAASLERPPKGILMLTSCAPGQISMEDKQFGHGVFMHFLLEGLDGKADTDGKGRVSLVDLYKYANRHTKAYVMRTFNGYQTPALKGDINDDFDFRIAGPDPGEILDTVVRRAKLESNTSVLVEIAILTYDLGNKDGAAGMLRDALEAAHSGRDENAQSSILVAIANAYLHCGDKAAAIGIVREALALASTLPGRSRCDRLRDLAEVQFRLGDKTSAEKTLEESVRVAGLLGEDLASSYCIHAAIVLQLRIGYLNEAMNNVALIKTRVWRVRSLIEVAKEQAKAGDKTNAQATFSEAVDKAHALNDKSEARGIADAQVEVGFFDDALRTAESFSLAAQDQIRASIVHIQATAGDLDSAQRTAKSISSNESTAKALLSIVTQQANVRQFDLALQTAQSIKLDEVKADALAAICERQSQSGLVAKALDTAKEITSLGKKACAFASVARAQAAAGDIAAAMNTLEQAVQMAERSSQGNAYEPLALEQARLGLGKEALASLARSAESGRKQGYCSGTWIPVVRMLARQGCHREAQQALGLFHECFEAAWWANEGQITIAKGLYEARGVLGPGNEFDFGGF